MFVKLRYTDFWEGKISANDNAISYAFYGNSIFDPYTAVGGHQPYAMDVWKQLYRRYRVFGSKISVTTQFNKTGNSDLYANLNGINTFVVPVTDSTVVHESTLAEMPRCRYRCNWGVYPNRPSRIKHYASTCQVWGVSKQTAATNAEFSALTTANPAAPWYWWITASRPVTDSPSDTAQPIFFRVTLIYYVVFYDRVWLGTSGGV